MIVKKYLILVNSANMMGEYHIGLGDELVSKGQNVTYAFIDKLPIYREKLDVDNKNVYIFSEYFKQNFSNNKIVPEKYKDININKLYFSDYDRINKYSGVKKFKDDYYQSLMINLINFFDEIQNENKFDFCIYESISNSFAYAAFEVLKRNGVSYCGYAGCRLKDRFELYTEEFGSVNFFKNKFENTNVSNISLTDSFFADEYLKKYSSNITTPSYHPKKTHLDWNYSIFKNYLTRKKINFVIGSIIYLVKESKTAKYSFQSPNPLKEIFVGLKFQLKKQYRLKVANKYFDKINKNEKFYLYPQHFKPEASTSVLSKHFCDDIAIITNIAFNLPFGTKLYVKEHFVNFGRLPLSYYKTLKNIPNVKLISHNQNIKHLIENSEAIITHTSTVGFEALMLNKPVFVFGNVFYECHPNCRKIYDFENFHNQILDLSVNKDPDINRRFIVAYKNSSYEGNIYYSLFKNYKIKDFTEPFINALNERFHK